MLEDMKKLSFALILLTTVSLHAQTVGVAPATPAAKLVQSLAVAASDDVRAFYGPAGYSLAWTRNGRPTPQAQAVIALLENAAAKGLEAADYDGGQWGSRVNALRNDNALATFDVDLTSAVMHYASDLRIGRVRPDSVEFALESNQDQLHLPSFAARLATANDVNAVVASIEPQHADYRRLLIALAKYRRIAAESQNDAPLPLVAKLAPGSEYAGIAQLTTILRRNGDLTSGFNGTRYEGALVDAVKHFQARHGLDADGVIGRTTFAQLATPASKRVEQIEFALERWRWMPSQFAGPAILVNIPEFKLTARDGKEELTMRVVVGKAAGHQTPVFDGDIKHVVFRPSWSVPPNIQRHEILPKIEQDHGYLAAHRYELVDNAGRSAGSQVDGDTIRRIRNGSLRVRQTAGTHNALGLVKFLFPNDNNVYLHSTPQQALFARSRRDFSHGCIRVEDPAELAAWVLRAQPEWNETKIAAAMNGKRDDVYVKVQRPVSVVLFYATAIAQENGDVHFVEDIYGHDVQLAKVLAPAGRGAAVMVAAK
ncbi:MAG: L,D-transpeptidase YcbB [Acidobacteriota bacterium]|jgi:murein L,D-transpeptidase YcbB/YkuD|nr:L,D-transpeptidase YcbB [Acidobacteriota bacterium]